MPKTSEKYEKISDDLRNRKLRKLAAEGSKIMNNLGVKIDITTLTTVLQDVSEQLFFKISVPDYLPLVVGEGAYSDFLVNYRSYSTADDFETGLLGNGNESPRVASADAAFDTIKGDLVYWAKGVNWNLINLRQFSRARVVDLLTSKFESRKQNWDLGIQRVAFLGLRSKPSIQGLLNNSSINDNETVITKPISTMSTSELKTLSTQLYEAYRANCNRTQEPNCFLLPESDYNGLTGPTSPVYPIKSTLNYLEEMFQTLTKNPSFKILKCAYADAANSDGALTQQTYMLYDCSDKKSIRMDLPVDFTPSPVGNTPDGFNYYSTAYGQFSGVRAIRDRSALYFSYTP